MKNIITRIGVAAVLLLLFSYARPLPDSSSPVDGSAGRVAAEEVRTEGSAAAPRDISVKVEALAERIRAAERVENEETAARLGVSLESLKARTERLRFVQSIYERAAARIEEKKSLENGLTISRESNSMQKEMEAPGAPPYSLAVYENLVARLSAAEQGVQANQLEINLLNRFMETIQFRLVGARRNLRILKDKARDASEENNPGAIAFEVEGAEVEVELLVAFLRLRGVERQNAKILLEEANLLTEQIRRQTDRVRNNLRFSREEFESMLKELDAKKTRLQNRLEKLTHEEKGVHASWLKARERAENADGEHEGRLADAVLQERDAWLKTYRETISLTSFLILLIENDRDTLT